MILGVKVWGGTKSTLFLGSILYEWQSRKHFRYSSMATRAGKPSRTIVLRIKESDDLQLGCRPGALARFLFREMQDIWNCIHRGKTDIS